MTAKKKAFISFGVTVALAPLAWLASMFLPNWASAPFVVIFFPGIITDMLASGSAHGQEGFGGWLGIAIIVGVSAVVWVIPFFALFTLGETAYRRLTRNEKRA